MKRLLTRLIEAWTNPSLHSDCLTVIHHSRIFTSPFVAARGNFLDLFRALLFIHRKKEKRVARERASVLEDTTVLLLRLSSSRLSREEKESEIVEDNVQTFVIDFSQSKPPAHAQSLVARRNIKIKALMPRVCTCWIAENSLKKEKFSMSFRRNNFPYSHVNAAEMREAESPENCFKLAWTVRLPHQRTCNSSEHEKCRRRRAFFQIVIISIVIVKLYEWKKRISHKFPHLNSRRDDGKVHCKCSFIYFVASQSGVAFLSATWWSLLREARGRIIIWRLRIKSTWS